MKIIETPRLILRTWRESDTTPFFQLNQDPRVIEFLPSVLTKEQVQAFTTAVSIHQEKHGYSLWAVELKKTGDFMGYIGLNNIDWMAHFTPAVEIAWCLDPLYWEHGYATEGGQEALGYGFTKCRLPEIVGITVPNNTRSIKIMEKIGMTRDLKGNFSHPKLPPEHPLSRHILYRIKSPQS